MRRGHIAHAPQSIQADSLSGARNSIIPPTTTGRQSSQTLPPRQPCKWASAADNKLHLCNSRTIERIGKGPSGRFPKKEKTARDVGESTGSREWRHVTGCRGLGAAIIRLALSRLTLLDRISLAAVHPLGSVDQYGQQRQCATDNQRCPPRHGGFNPLPELPNTHFRLRANNRFRSLSGFASV